MNEYVLLVIATFMAICSMIFSSLASASHPYEFHADARMAHVRHGPMDKAYGYMYVVTDASGRGSINVMFSNGNADNWARFNARVRFLNAAGRVVKEEVFESWLDAAADGTIERRVARSLEATEFETIEVDFYLSDISDRYASASVDTVALPQ